MNCPIVSPVSLEYAESLECSLLLTLTFLYPSLAFSLYSTNPEFIRTLSPNTIQYCSRASRRTLALSLRIFSLTIGVRDLTSFMC